MGLTLCLSISTSLHYPFPCVVTALTLSRAMQVTPALIRMAWCAANRARLHAMTAPPTAALTTPSVATTVPTPAVRPFPSTPAVRGLVSADRPLH